ncbi:hypothetical protein PVMG_03646 [Plasmodium vivax Mauritania I]|uniref:Uncharacterized protein n=1 Tax=Plasmodium vivax Mauritania I TaxID=1035515 RepID=A0A0J9TBA6_PLAVI|nr:hypothetical protein PVMG_03646 [Plasmodium vivax Mauritania I]
MPNYLGNNEFSNLNTKYYYDKLDDGWNDCEHDSFYDTAKEKLNEFKELRDESDKILKSLCYVYKRSSRVDFDNNLCNFLYYWLGSILLVKLEKKYFFQEIIINLFNTLKNNSNDKICNFVYTHIDEDIFDKIKLIFDYTEDYVKYEMDLVNPNSFCNEKYHSYLTTYVKTYRDLYDKCKLENKTDRYCPAFEKYYNVDRHINLYTWSCTLKKATEVHPLREVSGRTVHQGKLEGISVGGSQSELSQQTIIAEKQVGELPVQLGHNFNGETSESIITALPSDDKSTSITSKSITGAVSVAGFLVPSYLMYNVIITMIIKLNVIYYI